MQSLRRWRWKRTTSSKVRGNCIGDGKPIQAFRFRMSHGFSIREWAKDRAERLRGFRQPFGKVAEALARLRPAPAPTETAGRGPSFPQLNPPSPDDDDGAVPALLAPLLRPDPGVAGASELSGFRNLDRLHPALGVRCHAVDGQGDFSRAVRLHAFKAEGPLPRSHFGPGGRLRLGLAVLGPGDRRAGDALRSATDPPGIETTVPGYQVGAGGNGGQGVVDANGHGTNLQCKGHERGQAPDLRFGRLGENHFSERRLTLVDIEPDAAPGGLGPGDAPRRISRQDRVANLRCGNTLQKATVTGQADLLRRNL